MAGDLSGHVALIAGGGGEIGGAIARRFAEAGAAIAIADIRREAAEIVAGEITAAGGQAVAVRTNVAVEQDAERAVRHAVEAFGKLTTLVNVAAAVTPDGTVETLTLDDWNDALARQPHRRVPDVQIRGAAAPQGRRRHHHQHRLAARPDRHRQPRALHHQQGRADPVHALPRGRSRRRRHPRQFAVAGRHRHRPHPAPFQGPRGSEPRPRPGLPAGPSRPGRGSRGWRHYFSRRRSPRS